MSVFEQFLEQWEWRRQRAITLRRLRELSAQRQRLSEATLNAVPVVALPHDVPDTSTEPPVAPTADTYVNVAPPPPATSQPPAAPSPAAPVAPSAVAPSAVAPSAVAPSAVAPSAVAPSAAVSPLAPIALVEVPLAAPTYTPPSVYAPYLSASTPIPSVPSPAAASPVTQTPVAKPKAPATSAPIASAETGATLEPVRVEMVLAPSAESVSVAHVDLASELHLEPVSGAYLESVSAAHVAPFSALRVEPVAVSGLEPVLVPRLKTAFTLHLASAAGTHLESISVAHVVPAVMSHAEGNVGAPVAVTELSVLVPSELELSKTSKAEAEMPRGLALASVLVALAAPAVVPPVTIVTPPELRAASAMGWPLAINAVDAPEATATPELADTLELRAILASITPPSAFPAPVLLAHAYVEPIAPEGDEGDLETLELPEVEASAPPAAESLLITRDDPEAPQVAPDVELAAFTAPPFTAPKVEAPEFLSPAAFNPEVLPTPARPLIASAPFVALDIASQFPLTTAEEATSVAFLAPPEVLRSSTPTPVAVEVEPLEALALTSWGEAPREEVVPDAPLVFPEWEMQPALLDEVIEVPGNEQALIAEAAPVVELVSARLGTPITTQEPESWEPPQAAIPDAPNRLLDEEPVAEPEENEEKSEPLKRRRRRTSSTSSPASTSDSSHSITAPARTHSKAAPPAVRTKGEITCPLCRTATTTSRWQGRESWLRFLGVSARRCPRCLNRFRCIPFIYRPMRKFVETFVASESPAAKRPKGRKN